LRVFGISLFTMIARSVRNQSTGRLLYRDLLLSLLLVPVLACGSAPPPEESSQPILILVSIDGFRWDFRDRGTTPNLDRLVAKGVSARKLIPVFPSKTFPNHYTVVTGLYPENHGLVANNIYDPAFDAIYGLSKRDEVGNGRWYGGEPIWVAAEAAGKPTAPIFWPGSEAEIDGYRPTFWEPFDGSVDDHRRVDKVLALLDLPPTQRPVFLTLYFDTIDHAAHDLGPGPSQNLQRAVEHVDAMIGRLLDGLENRGLAGRVDVIVISDHGMAENSRERVILIDEILDLDIANPVDWDPVLGLWPEAGMIDEVLERLQGAHPHLKVFRREDIPVELHYNHHPRIPPIIAIADDGWAISSSERFMACSDCFTGGSHGYDPRLESMGGLFIAAGPSFQHGITLPSLENVHLYHLMCAVLGLQPAPNDGDVEIVPKLLRPRSDSLTASH